MADTPFNLSKANSVFLKIAAISTGIVAVFGLYSFYRNNIWSPEIKVDSVDYDNGIARLTINGKPFVLRGDSSYLIEYDWGIKFGTSYEPNGKRFFDRIEILKRGLVHKILRNKDEVHSFTGVSTIQTNGYVKNNKEAGFVGNEETFWDDAFFGDKGSFGVNISSK